MAKVIRLLVAVLIALAGLTISSGPALSSTIPANTSNHGFQHIRLIPVGKPTWKPVDLRLFSAPIGTVDTSYAEFAQTQERLLPAPDHVPYPQLGIGPGAAHAPPYDKELRNGVRSSGFAETSIFTADQFSAGAGVWLVWMNVPNPGKRGSSPDFESGRIVPNNLFPMAAKGSTYQNGRLFSTPTEFTIPKLDDALNPPFHVDGHSHFPVFFADNFDFALHPERGIAGWYRFDFKVTDQTSSGWRVQADYIVRPGGVATS
jgi:hypothetical protein